ncbi:MAG: thrombospondin type 3 repeat-containing protein [Muribaculaceae bacterium]|nr:thrombospondin type 3 repeat-containing protein [Muribaculaceae bacterium]
MYHVWATIYVDGNVNPDFADVTRDNWNYGIWMQIDSKYRNNAAYYNLDKDRMHLDAPVKYYYVTTHSAEDTYNRVLDYAGASLARDSHDALMVSDTRNGTATYTGNGEGNGQGIIDSPLDNRPADAPDGWSPWPMLQSLPAATDTDGDGIPDEWELAHGLDPDNAADGNIINDEGYTMVEVYINSLVDHITEAQNRGGNADGYREYYPNVKDSYEISLSTRQGDSGWNFDGGISLSGGSYGNQGNYISFSRNSRHSITLPERAHITRIKVVGYGRYTTDSYSDASLIQLGDKLFNAGTYSLPKGNIPGEFTVDISPSATGTLDMVWSDNNPCCIITLYTTPSELGIESPSATNSTYGDNRWYNMQGIEVSSPSTPGIYIHNNKKILIR